MSRDKGIGGWNIRSVSDLQDVTLPSTAGKSREVDEGVNDPQAQSQAAAQLAYTMHGQSCFQCGNATHEGGLCPTGQAIYQRMRELGVVS